MALLEIRGVSKGYGPRGQRTEVLKDIDLSIEDGEFVAIVGYSGAGKTTLLSLLAGLVHPDTGSIHMEGKRVTGPDPERGVVFQNYSLLSWLTVRENVLLSIREVFPRWSRAQQREQAERYLSMVKLTAAIDKRPGELSGGMRQRTALARALAMEPRVLLMDEPLSALDALTRATLQDEIVRIWSEHRRTVLLITNDVDEGVLLADRIVPLSQGPAATLGPGVAIDIDRPRDRKAMNHDRNFQRVRNQVIGYLTGAGLRQPATKRVLCPTPMPSANGYPVGAAL
jgi:nitrate/nitrite transport system ATP-binding protein